MFYVELRQARQERLWTVGLSCVSAGGSRLGAICSGQFSYGRQGGMCWDGLQVGSGPLRCGRYGNMR